MGVRGTTAGRKIRVLIVDDSEVMRRILADHLARDGGIEVVGTAANPYVARDMIPRLEPDVLTLDVQMPGMDGLTFLEKLMRARPMPVVMVSSFTREGCETTLRALELGAVDFVAKSERGSGGSDGLSELVAKIKVAAGARPQSARAAEAGGEAWRASALGSVGPAGRQRLAAIGASTGGTQAIREILTAMPADGPPLVIVQHMPRRYTRSFAERCNSDSAIRVREAEDGDEVRPGQALIAPGDHQMRIDREGPRCVVRVRPGPAVNGHRPSVDVLFLSVAATVGPDAVGILLTGMGADGARGLLAMKRAGAETIAQDEATSVVFGMPGEAIALGAADHVLPLPRIARKALELCTPPGLAALGAARKAGVLDGVDG
ncbi:MAG TPA: chemotaxis response regulator protein-glutamate methylesterase [Methylomirabilota bacterium]|nr:chemotaxis response regulator protein-glutamate methylesterase [Methylomirabilota bacterium]